MAGDLVLAMVSIGSMPALVSASASADGQVAGGDPAFSIPRPGAGAGVGAMATRRTVGMDATRATPTTAMYMRTIICIAAGRALPMAAISAAAPTAIVAAGNPADPASNRPATAPNRRVAETPALVAAQSPTDR